MNKTKDINNLLKNLLTKKFNSSITINIENIAKELKKLFIPYCKKADLDNFFDRMLKGIFLHINYLERLENIYNWIQSELIKVKTLINEGKKIDLNPLITLYFLNDIEKILDHNCFKIISPTDDLLDKSSVGEQPKISLSQVETNQGKVPDFNSLLEIDSLECNLVNFNLSQQPLTIINWGEDEESSYEVEQLKYCFQSQVKQEQMIEIESNEVKTNKIINATKI